MQFLLRNQRAPPRRRLVSGHKDSGLAVIGVHTPRVRFRRSTSPKSAAIWLSYPIALDNNYATWTNYRNRYCASITIDAAGTVRHISSEKAITTSPDVGQAVNQPASNSPPPRPTLPPRAALLPRRTRFGVDRRWSTTAAAAPLTGSRPCLTTRPSLAADGTARPVGAGLSGCHVRRQRRRYQIGHPPRTSVVVRYRHPHGREGRKITTTDQRAADHPSGGRRQRRNT